MFALDLDEVDEVAARTRGFSRNRRNLYEFRDRDHLQRIQREAQAMIAQVLEQPPAAG